MANIRINDLARELEVKSRVILDALPAVGFTEHKTHSSAIDEEVAEKVRQYVLGGGRAAAPAAAAETAPAEPAAAEAAVETAPAAPEPARFLAPPPIQPAPLPTEATPTPAERLGPRLRPAPPVAAAGAPSRGMTAPRMPVAGPRPVYAAPVAPVAGPQASPPAAPAAAKSAAGVAAPRPAAPAAPGVSGAPPAPMALSSPLTPSAPRIVPRVPTLSVSAGPTAASPAPGRRVIVPMAPQRPVYQAPPVESGARGVVGRPAPGKPIYQRPQPLRPGPAPAGRAATPEGRRPMHPTRPGSLPPRGAPPRGAHHARREPRVKEGPQRFHEQPQAAPSGPLPITREITLVEGMTVKDLSERLQVRAKDVIRKLLDRGLMATVNQALDSEVAALVSREFGAEAKTVSFEEEARKEVGEQVAADLSRMEPRAPVVTIMGHVDHGKTSLLDAIRQSNVAGGEAGGITQHIGAYHVEVADPNSPAHGRRIVFIDTPGHEAFTRMRARGARVTDLVVLVVAADDGVMPQTLEAIDHAKAANVPILVAVNKIDKPDAQPERVKKQLADRGLMPEDWGGSTVMVNVSAKARTNLNQLLELILLVTDLQELKANPDAPAQGTVLEAELDRGRGSVARVLVQEGTLRLGDTILLGSVLGRVRALFDDRGNAVSAAGPSTPVEVLGLESLPEAGDRWAVASDRYKAKQIALYREEKAREQALAHSSRLKLESLSQQVGAASGTKELPLIVKADVQGSAEVLVDALGKLSTDAVKVRIIHSGVGAVTETDVLLASASNAVIIGFNVRPERKASELAEHEDVEIRLHSIIYELADEIRRAMTGLLEPVIKETMLGRAEVREIFRIPKVGAVAGCYVREGKLAREAAVRVLRDGAVVYTSKIASLRRFKEDATEVRAGLECGATVANFSDLKPGDTLEAFALEKINPVLT